MIIAESVQQDTKEFKITITSNTEEVIFKCEGGDGLSSDRIAVILTGLKNGMFDSNIESALTRWGELNDLDKALLTLEMWREMRNMSPSKYVVRPTQVFPMNNLMGVKHE